MGTVVLALRGTSEHRKGFALRGEHMSSFSPIRGTKWKQPLQLPLAFLGQFLVIALVILLFVLYVSNLRIG
jgi:hypothetical protein